MTMPRRALARVVLSACPVCDYYRVELGYSWLSRQYERVQEINRRFDNHRQVCEVYQNTDLVEQLWPGVHLVTP